MRSSDVFSFSLFGFSLYAVSFNGANALPITLLCATASLPRMPCGMELTCRGSAAAVSPASIAVSSHTSLLARPASFPSRRPCHLSGSTSSRCRTCALGRDLVVLRRLPCRHRCRSPDDSRAGSRPSSRGSCDDCSSASNLSRTRSNGGIAAGDRTATIVSSTKPRSLSSAAWGCPTLVAAEGRGVAVASWARRCTRRSRPARRYRYS